jgi:hypothetical protein
MSRAAGGEGDFVGIYAQSALTNYSWTAASFYAMDSSNVVRDHTLMTNDLQLGSRSNLRRHFKSDQFDQIYQKIIIDQSIAHD